MLYYTSCAHFCSCSFLCPYRWLPLAELINVPDVNMVMAPIAATFVDNHRKQLIAVIALISFSLEKERTF